MRAFGVPSYLVECIANIYARNTTVVRTAGGVTGEIPVGRGVRQGCPLSGIVFNLVAEVLAWGHKPFTMLDTNFLAPTCLPKC